MALEKRSLINENMMAIMTMLKRGSVPVPRSVLYFSATEKEEYDYLLGTGLIEITGYEDLWTGSSKEGIRLSELGERIYPDLYNVMTGIGKYNSESKTVFGKNESFSYFINGMDDSILEMIDNVTKGIHDKDSVNEMNMVQRIVSFLEEKLVGEMNGFVIDNNSALRTFSDMVLKKVINNVPSENLDDWYFIEIKIGEAYNINEMSARMGISRKIVALEMKARKKSRIAKEQNKKAYEKRKLLRLNEST